MIYFIYGEDSYRAKIKLEEIIRGYKKVHKSGLNLIYIDAGKQNFKDFYGNLKITSMFAEKKLIILKNIFSAKGGPASGWQEDFLKNIKNLEEIKDIIIVYEDCAPDQRTKLFKELSGSTRSREARQIKCQGFNYLQPAMLKKWVAQEFSAEGGSAFGGEKKETRINPDALDLLVSFVGNDLWKMANEINKLSNYKAGSTVKKEDIELLVKPNIENDIFKTIDALASKDKKRALSLLHKHIDDGDNTLYLLSMISYQFRNLLIIKELQDAQNPYGAVIKKSGLRPFAAQKTYYLCNQFSMPELKKIYRKIFQIDSDIKTGKVEPETALDLLLAGI